MSRQRPYLVTFDHGLPERLVMATSAPAASAHCLAGIVTAVKAASNSDVFAFQGVREVAGEPSPISLVDQIEAIVRQRMIAERVTRDEINQMLGASLSTPQKERDIAEAEAASMGVDIPGTVDERPDDADEGVAIGGFDMVAALDALAEGVSDDDEIEAAVTEVERKAGAEMTADELADADAVDLASVGDDLNDDVDKAE